VYRLVCSICGSLGRETFEYGELADHNLREEKGYDPWCEKDGLTHGKRCITPGCTYTEQKPIPAIGHDMQARCRKRADLHRNRLESVQKMRALLRKNRGVRGNSRHRA